MMDDTANLVLEHLRAIRSDIARLANRMETMSVELTAIASFLPSPRDSGERVVRSTG
jgi:hypothetical protein